MHHPFDARRVAGIALILSLCACSGGADGNGPSRQIQLSTQAVSFSAGAPDAATPASQIVTATFSEEVVNLSVTQTGRGIGDVVTAVNGKTAQITLVPSTPSSLGAGLHTATVAVTGYFCADAACSRLEAGGSQTLTAKYQISPIVNYVAPYVAVSGTTATAVIRGVGFAGYAIQGAKFGEVAATAMTVVSDTEIRATYPALTAGTYNVTIDVPSHQGAIPSTATLAVIAPVTRAAETLAYPAAASNVRALLYDAQRAVLVVATDSGGGAIFSYPYAGGAWGPATNVAIADLQDAALSTDGARLLALSRTKLTPLDAATLVPGTAIDAPSLPTNSFLKNLAVVNTNQAIVTTGIAESKATELYSYAVRTAAMTKLSTTLNNATTGMPANGTLVGLIQGDPSLTTAPAFYTLNAATGAITASSISLNQGAVGPAFDRDATRLVLNGVNVYRSDFTLLGKLPTTTLAVVLSPDGKRAYTFDSAAAGILTFDISVTKSGEAYTALGAAVALAGAPGTGARMTISPDGATLFLAGATQLVVQPTPTP